jgi:hypothetical protein
MRRLTTGIRSEKCVVRRFGRCANVIECTYTNLDSIAYYRVADKSLARPTSRCILFDGENILFDASLVIYIVLIFLQL